MGFITTVNGMETKGQPLRDFTRDLKSVLNKHQAYYDSMRAAAGVPLDQLTASKINNYFGVTFSANDLTEGKACGIAFETFMTIMQPLIEALPVDDAG